jgi:hypothetical protein
MEEATMSTVVERAKPEQPWESDPWRYGWRYVEVTMPDGQVQSKRIPLSEADVLHPQEDDFIVQNAAHNEDCEVVKLAIKTLITDRPGFVVLHDCRIDWGVPGIEPHGPDIAVMEDVEDWNPTVGTFRVANHHAKVVLVIEITSPSTRKDDIGIKVDEYYRAGIPLYILVDAPVINEVRTLRLIPYKADAGGFEVLPLDERGRFWIEAIGMWIGADGTEVACWDVNEKRLGLHLGALREVEEARREVQAEKTLVAALRELAETRKKLVDAAEYRAEAETRRADAENKLAGLEKARANSLAAEADALRAKIQQLEAELRAAKKPPS